MEATTPLAVSVSFTPITTRQRQLIEYYLDHDRWRAPCIKLPERPVLSPPRLKRKHRGRYVANM